MTIPFALLGGLLAVILPSTTPWGAFYAGLSTPVVINTALKQTLQMGKTTATVPTPADDHAATVQAMHSDSAWKVFITAL